MSNVKLPESIEKRIEEMLHSNPDAHYAHAYANMASELYADLMEEREALEEIIESPENASDAYGAFKISIRAARRAKSKLDEKYGVGEE